MSGIDFKLDHDAADAITVAMLRHIKADLCVYIEQSAREIEKAHERQNLRDHHRTLEAVNELLRYLTGSE